MPLLTHSTFTFYVIARQRLPDAIRISSRFRFSLLPCAVVPCPAEHIMAKLLPQIIAIMAVVALCNLWVPALVPPAGQRFRSGVQVPLAGAAAMFGAAPAFADKIDDAARTLSEKSDPFLKEIDWTSPVYGSLPANPLAVLKAVKSALKMGADIDPAALKAGVLAHVKAIASVDGAVVAVPTDSVVVASALAVF